MKKFFITALCAGLFVTASSAWASIDDPQDKAPVKKECVEKKADVASTDGTKACCAEKKACCAEKKACCAENTAKAGETKACCAEKKACCAESTAKVSETKACCAEKKDCPKTACINKEADKDTKSSGKKSN